jgi:patatin-like phospholipase/acyl hydrolase
LTNTIIHVLIYNIDGGDVGGLSQIFILYEIANRIKFDLGLDELPRLCDYFDMIGGMGMGG